MRRRGGRYGRDVTKYMIKRVEEGIRRARFAMRYGVGDVHGYHKLRIAWQQ
jgi:hypothetical protein